MVAAIEETNSIAMRIARVQPVSIDGLVVHYLALIWLMLEADDMIVDAGERWAFIAFGQGADADGQRLSDTTS